MNPITKRYLTNNYIAPSYVQEHNRVGLALSRAGAIVHNAKKNLHIGIETHLQIKSLAISPLPFVLFLY